MDNLLQSMQNAGYNDASLDSAMKSLTLDNECVMTQQAQLRALASAALLSPNPPITLPRSHTQARNGFTPAEELILEAHAQRLQLRTQISRSSSNFESVPSLRNFSSTFRSLDPASHERLPISGFAGNAMFSQETLPTISEDDFHTMGHPPRRFVPTSHEFQRLTGGCPPTVHTAANTAFVRPPNRAVSIVAPPPDYEEYGKRPKGHQQRTERSARQSTLSGESKSHSSLIQASTPPNDISNNSNDNNSNTSTISRDKNHDFQHTYMYSHGAAQGYPEHEKVQHFRSSPATPFYSKTSPHLSDEPRSAVKEGPKSPAVVSPALTYSSRTPSTLSPATPFFGSFAGGQDAFEVMTMENEEAAERKLGGKVANK